MIKNEPARTAAMDLSVNDKAPRLAIPFVIAVLIGLHWIRALLRK